MISVADHPMRQRSRPRHERGGLTGKAYAAMATDTLGRKIRGVAQNSSRQQFLGRWSFLCRLHLQASQNTSTANGGWSTDQGETTKMTTLMEQEKQRISERLARLDAEREKLSGQLEELEIAERVLARFGGKGVTTERRRRTRPVPHATSRTGPPVRFARLIQKGRSSLLSVQSRS